ARQKLVGDLARVGIEQVSLALAVGMLQGYVAAEARRCHAHGRALEIVVGAVGGAKGADIEIAPIRWRRVLAGRGKEVLSSEIVRQGQQIEDRKEKGKPMPRD